MGAFFDEIWGGPLRDIVVILILAVSVPLCFFWPWAGSVLWGWLGFMAPTRVLWGLSFGLYLGWLPVVATLAGLARAPRRYRLPRSRAMMFLLAFWAFCALTTVVAAVYPERAWPRFIELSRILLMMLVVMTLSLERHRLHVLIWVTALCVGAYAAGGAVWVLLTGGVAPLYGPRGSDIENNNDLAATLVAVAPFFVFLGPRLPRRWLRHGALALFAATVVAILGTYSRAAVLALVLVLVLLGLCRQWRALAVAGVAFALFMACTTPRTWFDRVDTIRTYRQEPSAALRPGEWYVALRIGLDHPLLGAGFRPFSAEAYRRYIPGSSDHRDAHNLFLQVFAEHGFPGLALYAALIVSTLATLWRTARRSGAGPETAWLRDVARMLVIGMLGYILDAQFHCLSYRAAFFDLVGLSIMVDTLARGEPRERVSTPQLRDVDWSDRT